MAQNRGGPFLILAVVLGLAASAVVFFYLNQQSAANVTARQTRPVVVAASDVTFGTKLDRNLLKVVNYPKDSVPPNAYSSLDSVVGQTKPATWSGRAASEEKTTAFVPSFDGRKK